MLTTGAPPNILIRANIYNNDPIRYIVLVVSCFVLPIPNIYRDTSVLIPVLSWDALMMTPSNRRLLRAAICASVWSFGLFCPLAFTTALATVVQLPSCCSCTLFCHRFFISTSGWPLAMTLPLVFAARDNMKSRHLLWASVTTSRCPRQ